MKCPGCGRELSVIALLFWGCTPCKQEYASVDGKPVKVKRKKEDGDKND